VSELLCAFITVFIVILFVRAVLSWFPLEGGGFLAQVNRLATDATEWAVAPLRRIIPPIGMFDVSFIVLVFGLFILRGVVC
jgi:YggT family protein